MTRSILNLAAAAIAILTLAYTPAVQAQTLAVVNVPFAFEVGTSRLAAGTYTISLRGNFMDIRGASGFATSIARWNPESTDSASARVVFHRYGSQYFLREVWDAGQDSHLENIESSAEAKARKAPKDLMIAGAGAASTEVIIAATAR